MALKKKQKKEEKRNGYASLFTLIPNPSNPTSSCSNSKRVQSRSKRENKHQVLIAINGCNCISLSCEHTKCIPVYPFIF